jgi:hypothetical protein
LFWRRFLYLGLFSCIHWWKFVLVDWLRMAHFCCILLWLLCLLWLLWAFAFPAYSRRFDHDLVFEGRQLSLGVRKVQPCDVIFIQNLKPENILSSNGKVFLEMLESHLVFFDIDSKDIRHFWVVLVFRDIVVDKRHLFLHLFVLNLQNFYYFKLYSFSDSVFIFFIQCNK